MLTLSRLLAPLGRAVRARLPEAAPWTNVYGLARTLLALSSALTLACSPLTALFVPRPAEGMPAGVQCSAALSKVGLYCLGNAGHLDLKRWLAVAVLLVVASGYRPRYLGLLHWWITFSFQANAIVVDGGDQLAAIMTLLLIPVTLTDARAWHWSAPVPAAEGSSRPFVARWSFALIRLQVAAVYYHASVGKCPVTEWSDGTAVYYWLTHPGFGAPRWLVPLLRPVLLNGVAVTTLTWGVILLEILLCAGLLATPRHRAWLLVAGVLLHAGILVVHGLVSFSLVMFAALILYLRPLDVPLTAPRFLRRRARLAAEESASLDLSPQPALG